MPVNCVLRVGVRVFSLYASRIQRGGVRLQCMSLLYMSVLSIEKRKL